MNGNTSISLGDLAAIFKNHARYENPSGGYYQCSQTKKAEQVATSKKNLILINDGMYHMKALLRGEASQKALSQNLKRGDIFRVLTAEPAVIKEKKKFALIIDDFEITQRDVNVNPHTEFIDAYFAAHPNEVINLDNIKSDDQAMSLSPAISGQPQKPSKPQSQPQPQQQTHFQAQNDQYLGSGSQKTKPIFAIEQLSPYQNMWTIKARVSYKGDIKTWHNQRGEGKLFNVNFLDTSGEIRATAFNDNALKYYEILQEGKVYYVSKARIQPSKPQFSNLKHPYELQLDRDTVVEECFEAADVPKMNFNFVKLKQLATMEANSNVDVLGIVQTVNPAFEMTAKSGKKFNRRDIVIVDETNLSITVGLWNEQAIDFNLPEGSVIAVKSARVTDFGGKSLSMGFSSTLHPNPDIPEAFALKGWYSANANSTNFQSLKADGGEQTGTKFIANRITISRAKEDNLGRSDKGDYFNVKGAINFLKVDNFAYPSCSSEDCRKKVIEQTDGSWRCEKCQLDFPSPRWRYMLTASILDETSQIWLTIFDEQAEKLLGMDANKLTDLKNNDPEQFQKVTQSVQMNEFDFRVRAREDTYNEETRIRYTVTNLYPLRWKNEADFLAVELSKAILC
ncbi:HFL008Cp [Eremothecium sinecaudum]|uniref:Replication protein A subunit n=1 Tax=Eremothecium sinecaudum TaxID=45286 RepID=A0A0X8HUW9_9SACH|nr:HFL008Cp [Eremothecium sinecaudum]AMD21848.1 HFL008Cp [Eremothecium sinecaudum]